QRIAGRGRSDVVIVGAELTPSWGRLPTCLFTRQVGNLPPHSAGWQPAPRTIAVGQVANLPLHSAGWQPAPRTIRERLMALFDFVRDNWPLLLAPLLGLVAVYALLPRPNRPPVLLGIGAGSAAMLLAGFFIVRVGGVTIE